MDVLVVHHRISDRYSPMENGSLGVVFRAWSNSIVPPHSTRSQGIQSNSHRQRFGNIRVWGSNLRQKSVWVNLIEEQIADLFRSLKLPLDWDREVRKILQEKDGGPDPVNQRKEIRVQLCQMRIGYERGMYNDEEHVFWREVESLQEKMNRLEHPQADAINRAAKTLLNLREIWENATREEQRELAQMMLQEVGCSVFEKRVVWIKPRMGFEILFQLVGDLRPAENGRF